MDHTWERVLAFFAMILIGGALWFFIFWSWFAFWKKHRVLTFFVMASTLLGSGVLLDIFDYWRWFGGQLSMAPWAKGIGWALIALSAVFGWTADRQIGMRVRSFMPFFDRRGHIDLRTTGAYGVVRHPIYAAGICFQLGTFLVTGYPGVLLACAVWTLAALWFTRQEEERLKALLDDPEDYDRYRERVPALFPRMSRRR